MKKSMMMNRPVTAPLGGCIFFGVPNQVNNASILDHFNSAYQQGFNLIDEEKKEQHIMNSAHEFSDVRGNYSIPVFCLIEAEESGSTMVSRAFSLTSKITLLVSPNQKIVACRSTHILLSGHKTSNRLTC